MDSYLLFCWPLTLYPGDVCSLIEQPPDQLTQGGPQHRVPDEGLAGGHPEHALVRGPECHKVPGGWKMGFILNLNVSAYFIGGSGHR